MKIEINIHKKHAWRIVAVLIFFATAVFVIAQGVPNPGHGSDEIVEADPTVVAHVKNGVAWGGS
jgi:hypothetical protein